MNPNEHPDSVTPLVVAPAQTVDIYHELMTGVQTGSYAVLCAIVIIYLLTRRALATAWEKHFKQLDTLMEATANNANSLQVLARSQERIADLMSSPVLASTQAQDLNKELLKVEESINSVKASGTLS